MASIGLPRLNKLGADVQITGEHCLGPLKRGTDPLHRDRADRLRRKRKAGCPQAALALGVLKRLVSRLHQLVEHCLLDGCCLICCTMWFSCFFWSAVSVSASFFAYT